MNRWGDTERQGALLLLLWWWLDAHRGTRPDGRVSLPHAAHEVGDLPKSISINRMDRSIIAHKPKLWIWIIMLRRESCLLFELVDNVQDRMKHNGSHRQPSFIRDLFLTRLWRKPCSRGVRVGFWCCLIIFTWATRGHKTHIYNDYAPPVPNGRSLIVQ